MLIEAGDQVVDLGDLFLYPRLHQRFEGGGKQVDDRLFAAAQAGSVSAGHGAVIFLVEQQSLERADLLVEVLDTDELGGGGRQVEPEVPVVAEPFDGGGTLRHRAQGVVIADRKSTRL